MCSKHEVLNNEYCETVGGNQMKPHYERNKGLQGALSTKITNFKYLSRQSAR